MLYEKVDYDRPLLPSGKNTVSVSVKYNNTMYDKEGNKKRTIIFDFENQDGTFSQFFNLDKTERTSKNNKPYTFFNISLSKIGKLMISVGVDINDGKYCECDNFTDFAKALSEVFGGDPYDIVISEGQYREVLEIHKHADVQDNDTPLQSKDDNPFVDDDIPF